MKSKLNESAAFLAWFSEIVCVCASEIARTNKEVEPYYLCPKNQIRMVFPLYFFIEWVWNFFSPFNVVPHTIL